MSFRCRRFSLIEPSQGKLVVFTKNARCGWAFISREIQRFTCAAGWRHLRMVFMVQLRRDILKAQVSFPSSPFIPHFLCVTYCTASSFPPYSSHPPLHRSTPENVNLHGFKYAHSELGVNHHFVFITYSLSSLSRCVRGMTNWGVRKYSCCFWLQSTFFQWALPRGCSSSALVLRPNETLIGSRAVPCMPVKSSDLINH